MIADPSRKTAMSTLRLLLFVAILHPQPWEKKLSTALSPGVYAGTDTFNRTSLIVYVTVLICAVTKNLHGLLS